MRTLAGFIIMNKCTKKGCVFARNTDDSLFCFAHRVEWRVFINHQTPENGSPIDIPEDKVRKQLFLFQNTPYRG